MSDYSDVIARLHHAFRWDCDGCGRENFERAISVDLAKHGKAYAKRAYDKAYHKKHDVKYSGPGPHPAARTPPPPAGVKLRKYNKE